MQAPAQESVVPGELEPLDDGVQGPPVCCHLRVQVCQGPPVRQLLEPMPV